MKAVVIWRWIIPWAAAQEKDKWKSVSVLENSEC